MNNMNVKSATHGVRSFRERVFAPYPVLRTFLFVLCALSMTGCVRLTGGAGYTKISPSGETTTRKATFDTADYVPGSPAPGSITT